jgi:hypothetical protein
LTEPTPPATTATDPAAQMPPPGMPPPPPVAPPSMVPPPVPPQGQGGRLRPIIAVGVLVVVLGGILWAVKDNASADDLKAGDCFNVPTSSSVSTVEKHACTESHDAEVFHVVEYDGGTTYPISLTLSSFIDTTCVPAFATYVGADVDARTDLALGYFYPSRDGWDGGDRTITCYIANDDESKLTKSVKGTGAGA